MSTLLQLFTGTDIRQSHTEVLLPASVQDIAAIICKGENGLANMATQLYQAKNMDKQAYERLKLRLPFFCCGHFEGNIRNGKNFCYTESLVLDIDGIESKHRLAEEIFPAIVKDERVVMAYTSPSGRGIKILMGLNSPVSSLQEFSHIYRQLATSFSKQYSLEQYIDLSTSDATRICFLAYDPNVYVNTNATLVNWQCLHTVAPTQTDFKVELPVEMAVTDFQSPPKNQDNSKLSAAVYGQVLEKIGLQKSKRPAAPPPYVPAILEPLAVQLQAAIAAGGWSLKELTNIQYGKKLAVANGFSWAEINIYYGSKGFSIVRSVKTGTDATLALQLEELAWKVLQTPCEVDYGINPDITA